MGEVKRKFPRAVAIQAAREIVSALKPVCVPDRLIVAGSLRRGKAEVGDAEIVFVPRVEERPFDLLTTHQVPLTDEVLNKLIASGMIRRRLNKDGHEVWGSKNKLAVHVSTGVPVDLFCTTEESWFNYLVCRTGPGKLNIRICQEALKRKMQWQPYSPGFKLEDGASLRVASEAAVFAAVGLPFREPWQRDALAEEPAP